MIDFIGMLADEDSEEFMEDVYKKELGTDFEKVDSGVGV